MTDDQHQRHVRVLRLHGLHDLLAAHTGLPPDLLERLALFACELEALGPPELSAVGLDIVHDAAGSGFAGDTGGDAHVVQHDLEIVGEPHDHIAVVFRKGVVIGAILQRARQRAHLNEAFGHVRGDLSHLLHVVDQPLVVFELHPARPEDGAGDGQVLADRPIVRIAVQNVSHERQLLQPRRIGQHLLRIHDRVEQNHLRPRPGPFGNELLPRRGCGKHEQCGRHQAHPAQRDTRRIRCHGLPPG